MKKRRKPVKRKRYDAVVYDELVAALVEILKELLKVTRGNK